VNGHSFEHGTKSDRALEILKGVCHLSVTVKSNLLAFQEMLQTPEDTPRSRSRGKSATGRMEDLSSELSSAAGDGRSSSMSTAGGHSTNSRDNTPANRKNTTYTASKGLAKSKINRAFNRFLHKPKSLMSMDTLDGDMQSGTNPMHLFNNSLSNPDLLTSSAVGSTIESDSRSEHPEHVLKVYKSDQTFKYLLVHKETTAHEVVMLSLQEFGITEPSSNFSLCEVTVAEGGFVKQRTLPDPLQNLSERIGLASRYYIKSKNSSESLLPDDNVNDLIKESFVNLLQLNPVEVSTQLMVEDFTIFRQIEATEYIDDLYELSSTLSRFGTPSLSLFAELVNREMMWTIGEIVSESNATKRMRIIKQFIKVARQCKETQNFNSMFAIISGLGHGAVSR
jgi:Rap guanine nucleotide exchange factor 2